MAGTDLLFHHEAYTSQFQANVVELTSAGALRLDRTCFYPGGGGQPHDVGALSGGGWHVDVVRVAPGSDGPEHWIAGDPPPVGTPVDGLVDWDRRYALMRTHTALHILCGIIWRDYRRLSTGCAMQPLAAHIDFELDQVDGELLGRLQAAFEVEVAAERPVVVRSLSREEAEGTHDLLRTKSNLLPRGLAQIRTVEIVGLDLQADGGTHVANTREVGSGRLVRYKSKGRANKRLYLELSPLPRVDP